MRVWVDPPEGWQYGFPRLWDSNEETNLIRWLQQNGYPDSVRESYGEFFMIRQWAGEDEPTNGP